MNRKITRKGLIRKLDKVVSQVVIKRDGKCIVCDSTQNLTCGHLFSRAHYSTRWLLDNCWAQCLSCNFKHELNAYPMLNAVEKVLGKEMVEDLNRKWSQPRKYKDFELAELYTQLDHLLQTL